MGRPPKSSYSMTYMKTVYEHIPSFNGGTQGDYQDVQKIQERIRDLRTAREALVKMSLEVEDQLQRQLQRIQQQSRSPTQPESQLQSPGAYHTSGHPPGSKPQSPGAYPTSGVSPQLRPQSPGPYHTSDYPPGSKPQSPGAYQTSDYHPGSKPQTSAAYQSVSTAPGREPPQQPQYHAVATAPKTTRGAPAPPGTTPSASTFLTGNGPEIVEQLVKRFNSIEKTAYEELKNIGGQQAVLKESMAAIRNRQSMPSRPSHTGEGPIHTAQTTEEA